MKYRKFGNTSLEVSEIGFGAWGIGGPSMAGDIPIGWGNVDDETSIKALEKAYSLGVNFYDTADFYGLGHSEELIGKVLSDKKDVIIATKVGHRLAPDNNINLDYSKDYIIKACEESLKRLNRDHIDLYQLHSAKLEHLEQGDCIEAMEQLKTDGKIRYWGISLNTFNPSPEADFLMKKKAGCSFQLVFNILNQKAIFLLQKAHKKGYGIIARMPLQFGLLTGKFNAETHFEKNDHRSFRLTPEVLSEALKCLDHIWPIADKYKISKTSFSLSFVLSFPEVSTTIPGIKTPEQAELNVKDIVQLDKEDVDEITNFFLTELYKVVDQMQKIG